MIEYLKCFTHKMYTAVLSLNYWDATAVCMCDFARVLDIIKHYIFILYNYMCVTIELYTTFICKGVKNIEGIINDGWQLPTT